MMKNYFYTNISPFIRYINVNINDDINVPKNLTRLVDKVSDTTRVLSDLQYTFEEHFFIEL